MLIRTELTRKVALESENNLEELMGAGPLRSIHSRRRTGIEVYRVWAAVRRPVTCL